MNYSKQAYQRLADIQKHGENKYSKNHAKDMVKTETEKTNYSIQTQDKYCNQK